MKQASLPIQRVLLECQEGQAPAYSVSFEQLANLEYTVLPSFARKGGPLRYQVTLVFFANRMATRPLAELLAEAPAKRRSRSAPAAGKTSPGARPAQRAQP